jgi:hypothetical protein
VPRIGKAQRALNKALDHRDAIEAFLAHPWTRRFLPESAFEFFESQLSKNNFHIYSKNERQRFAEIVAEMKPFYGYGEYSIDTLIDLAVSCKHDCRYPETEEYLDDLSANRPDALPLRHLCRLVAICQLRYSVPELGDEYAPRPDPGDEEQRRERAEARAARL